MISDLIEELQAAVTGYQSVYHAWTLDEIDRLEGDMPFALFIPGAVKSEPSPQLPIRQRVTEQVIVITICKWEQLADLRRELYGVMLGYQHTEGHTPIEHVSGETNRIAGDIIYWMDSFATQYWMSRVIQPNAFRLQTGGYLLIGGESLPPPDNP